LGVGKEKAGLVNIREHEGGGSREKKSCRRHKENFKGMRERIFLKKGRASRGSRHDFQSMSWGKEKRT